MNSIPGSPGEVSSSSDPAEGLADSRFQLDAGDSPFFPKRYRFPSEFSYEDESELNKALSEIKREDVAVNPDWRDDDPVAEGAEAILAIFLRFAEKLARIPGIDRSTFDRQCPTFLGWLAARYHLLPEQPRHVFDYTLTRYVWMGQLGGVVPKILRSRYWSRYEAIRNSVPSPPPLLSPLEGMLASLRSPTGAPTNVLPAAAPAQADEADSRTPERERVEAYLKEASEIAEQKITKEMFGKAREYDDPTALQAYMRRDPNPKKNTPTAISNFEALLSMSVEDFLRQLQRQRIIELPASHPLFLQR